MILLKKSIRKLKNNIREENLSEVQDFQKGIAIHLNIHKKFEKINWKRAGQKTTEELSGQLFK